MGFAEVLSAAGFALMALTGAVSALASAGPDAIWDIRAMRRTAAGGVLGGVTCMLGLVLLVDLNALSSIGYAFGGLVVMGLVGFTAVFFAGARLNKKSPKQRSRLAGLRGFVLVSSLCAMLFWTACSSRYYMMASFAAVADAPNGLQGTLVMDSGSLSQLCSRAGVCVLLPMLFAGVMSLSTVLVRMDNRVFVGATIGGLQLAGVGVFYAVAARSITRLAGIVG